MLIFYILFRIDIIFACNLTSNTVIMPKRSKAFNYRANYDVEPYSQVVSFPPGKIERTRWFEAMPNEPGSLKDRKEIFVCSSHFECNWVTVREESDQLDLLHILKVCPILVRSSLLHIKG